MASIERTAYPCFRPSLSERELETLYEPTPRERGFAEENTRSSQGRLTLLVFLKCYQHLGYLPQAEEVPEQVTRYLADYLDSAAAPELGARRRQERHRYQKSIRDFLGVESFSEGGHSVAAEAMREAAFTRSDPADLINVAIENLVKERFELPAFSTLDRLAGRVRREVHEVIYANVTGALTEEERGRLDALLEVRPEETITDFTRMKRSPGSPTLTRMREWTERLRWLTGLPLRASLLEGLPHTKVRQFASEAGALEAGDMKDIRRPGKRHTLLICLIHERTVRARDDLTEMFLKRMRRTHNWAQKKLRERQERQREIEEEMLAAFAEVLEEAAAPEASEAGRSSDTAEDQEETDARLGRRVRRVLAARGGADALWEKYQSVSTYHEGNYRPLLWDIHRRHRAALFRLLKQLGVKPATRDRRLADALRFIQNRRKARRDYVDYEIDLGFLSRRWRAYVEERPGGGEVLLKRRELEVCVMSHVADGLRSGDLYVPGSEKYADYREQLLPWEECTGRLPAYCESMGLPDGAEAFTRQLREHLEAAAERADAAFPENSELSIDEDGKPHLERMEAERAPDGTGALRETVLENMPERHLLDVLKDTRHWTGYTSRFGPPSGTVPKGPHAEAHHLFTVFGYGCNLGPAQTAQHSRGPGVTLRNLKRINDQHVTTAGLESALEDVIEEYARFELPFLWGSEEVAVADGTHVELVENNLLGERHIRYGGYGGIAYHHISDTYIALFSRFIACGVWEAVYILDGLLENESVLQPDTVHADTHGQSEPVFGLAHLLGIQLMPRMRNWNEVTFYRPSSEASYEHVDALFSRVADWGLIEARWKDLMQVALSVQAGTVLPSMLLRKLGTQSRQNQLYRAFRELGRVVRTIFLLEYISTAELRRSIHAATTKIESYNAFSDWLSFGGDVIRSGDPVEQEKRVKYRDLVANAVMLRNVADLTDVLADLKADGHDFTRDQVTRLSPYMTTHLKRFGQYVLDMDGQPPPLEPKSLDLVDEASPLC